MFVFLLKALAALTIVSMASSITWRLITPAFGAALPVTEYGSCSELRGDWPTGLAATQEAADRISRTARKAPRVFADAYVLNMHLDTQRRGVICPTH